jgi:hypothetical protein
MRGIRWLVAAWIVIMLLTIGSWVWASRTTSHVQSCRVQVIALQKRMNGLFGYLTGDPRYQAQYLQTGKDLPLRGC